jgi:hypothetical protein
MTNKNFINFHVLISHSPSCLNRDDMNMQKTAVFGGVNRVQHFQPVHETGHAHERLPRGDAGGAFGSHT